MITKVGLRILEIKDDSIASKAGLMVGDILLKYNDRVITKHNDLVEAISTASDEQGSVVLTVVRSAKEIQIKAESGALGISIADGAYNLVLATNNHNSKNLLIDFLGVVAWIALLLGIIGSLVIFSSLVNSEFALVGVISAIGVFIQSFIVFALLKVISTMASEVKSIKAKLDQ